MFHYVAALRNNETNSTQAGQFTPTGPNETLTHTNLETYRWAPGGLVIPLDDISDMLPPSFVERQAQELSHSLNGPEESLVEARVEDRTCLCCQTYKATRQAVPCGHLVCCRECLPRLLEPRTFSVTTATGGTSDTGVHLPVVCLQCRALVGQFIRPYL